jgi:hypothetical protein
LSGLVVVFVMLFSDSFAFRFRCSAPRRARNETVSTNKNGLEREAHGGNHVEHEHELA